MDWSWPFLPGEPAETSAVAFVTTAHCALVLLRRYRPRGGVLVFVPSIAFVVLPWFLSSIPWLAAGFAAHVTWFVACEKLLAEPPPAAGIVRAPPRPAQSVPLSPPVFRVLAVVEETPEIRTFRITRPREFAFRAGQFVMVRVVVDGQPLVRCYSITSAPSTPGYLEISVRRQGCVSRRLHETLQPGSTLHLTGPGGAFTYPSGDRPIVLLAGGIGITPLLSMLRHAIATEPERPVTLILSARTEAHVPFRDELNVLARRHPRFRLAVTLSQDSGPGFYTGRIDRALLERVVSPLRESVYMTCGPLPMIDEMRRVLETLGVPPAQVHFEKFETATAAAGAGAPATIVLRKRGRTLRAAGGQTILEAIEAAGETFPSMCRAGVCGTCRLALLEGEVEGDFDALDQGDLAAGMILACVARPVTNCVVDA